MSLYCLIDQYIKKGKKNFFFNFFLFFNFEVRCGLVVASSKVGSLGIVVQAQCSSAKSTALKLNITALIKSLFDKKIENAKRFLLHLNLSTKLSVLFLNRLFTREKTT